MSIEVMTKVWDLSRQKGTPLLLMIAIADNANKAGECWPGIDYLAEKTRISRRQVQRLLHKLEDEGELAVEYGTGRGYTHLLYVLIGLDPADQERIRADVAARNAARGLSREDETPEPDSPTDGEKGDKMSPFPKDEKGDIQGLKGDTQGVKGDIFDGKGDIAMSPEPINPLTNQREPERPVSKPGPSKPAALPVAKAAPRQPAAGPPPAPGEPPPDGLPDPQQVWGLIVGQLGAVMSRADMQTWITTLKATAWSGSTLRVAAANQYGRDWVDSRIKSMTTRILSGITNRSDVAIEFYVRGL
jgi:cell division septation protein DedD